MARNKSSSPFLDYRAFTCNSWNGFIKIPMRNTDMIYLPGKKVCVLGLGVSGRAAAEFLIKKGATVLGIDRNQELLEQNEELKLLVKNGLTVLHESAIPSMHEIDMMVVSPGIPPSN